MKILISESQYKRLFEQEDRAFSKAEVALFKNLNKNKEKLRSMSAYKDYLKRAMRVFGMSIDGDAISSILYTYIMNYREDGMYELTSKEETYREVPDKKLKRTYNVNADNMTKAMIPFKGSNLKANWEIDTNGVKQYVVLSYDWYPIFIYKNGQWYEVNDRYSSSTAKQIRNCRPSYDTISMSREEMKALRRGEDVFESKFDTVIEASKDLIGQEIRKRRMNGYPTIYSITGMVRDGNMIKVMVELKESDPSFRNYGDAKRMLQYEITPLIANKVGSSVSIGDIIEVEVTMATDETRGTV